MSRNIGTKNMKKSFFNKYIFIVLLSFISLYFILTKVFFVHGFDRSDWIRRVNRPFESKMSGSFLAKDKNGDAVILEWKKTSPKGKDYFDGIKKVSDLFCSSRIDEQLDFWRKYPSKCPAEFKMFLNDKIETLDQDLLKEKAIALGKLEFAPDFSDSDEIVFFVSVMDKKTSNILGAVIFGIGGNYEYGDIFIRDIVSKPEVRDRGLGTLLASSIFKIVPDIKRIRVYVLDTNKNAINVYSFWNFEKEELDPKMHKEGCLLMGYDVEKYKSLQHVAANLKFVD